MNIKLLLIITISIAIIYLVVFSLMQPEDILNLLNTVIGTFLSFFIAVLAGIYLFNWQTDKSNRARAEDLNSNLAAELSDLLRILNADGAMSITLPSGHEKRVLIVFIQPLIIESAALSGLFSQLDNENLLHLARKVRMFNFKVEYLMGLIQSKANEETIVHAIDNVEGSRISIIEGINKVAINMKIVINQNYPD